MSDKIIVSSQEELIEKWLPVIEGTGKWEKVVEGMPTVDSKNYGIMATQLECLEQVELTEATATGQVANYNPVLIPMVRRIAPAMIGNELFGVQPMTSPSGLIFALKSLYNGDATDAVTATYEIVLVDATVAAFQTPGTDVTGDVSGVGVITHAEGPLLLVKMTSGTFATSADLDDASTYSSSVAGVVRAFPDGENLAQTVFQNFSGTMTTAVGEFLGTETKEMGFEITSTTVNAKTRKLKTRWTIELEDDLRAVHGMNAEQLLSGFCGDEIVKEMNREFIDKVKGYANTASGGLAPATWDYVNVTTPHQFAGRYENERYMSMANEINRQRRKLALANLRGQATWMIVTLGVLTALEATGRLVKANDVPMANAYVGMFDGMRVYVDMFPTASATGTYEEACYFGYKGDEVDAGMYFCPYVPLKVNKGYGEEDNIPRLFFSTRYGLAENPFGAANYYQKLTISNLPGA